MPLSIFVLIRGRRAGAFVAAISAMLIGFSQPVLGQTYVPGEDAIQKMTPRDARSFLRKLGRIGVAWNGNDQFTGERYVAGVRRITIHGPRGAQLWQPYIDANPRVEQTSGLFSGSRSVVHVGNPPYGGYRDYVLYYAGSDHFEFAKKIADALVVLKRQIERDFGPEADKAFQEIVKQYRAADPKPQLTEEIRRYNVQAAAAVNEKDFVDASDLFGEVVRLAPWYPEGHFNYALVLGEIGEFEVAAREMQRYLALVPDAPNVRAAQDKIYEWERKFTK